jgi:dTDP-L-rhamnose 4-epimerase
MTENVLVTGGAGFIGSHLVDRLTAEGYRVRVIDNLDEQVHGELSKEELWPAYRNEQVEYVLGDVRDKEALRRVLNGIDVVFHLAAKVGVGQSMYDVRRYIDVNVGGTANLLDVIANDASIRDRIRKLIVASSMSNYGEGTYDCPVHGVQYPPLRPLKQLNKHQWELRCHAVIVQGNSGQEVGRCQEILVPRPTRESKPMVTNSVYGISKKTQEELCLTVGEAYGISTVALRYFNTYGTRQALSNPYTGVVAIFASRLLNRQAPVIFEDGHQIRDFIHVSDLVKANILVMNNQEATGIYNVGSGHPVTIQEIAKSVIDHMDSSLEPEIIDTYRKGDIRHCYADIGRLAALGFKPEYTFEKGIAETVEWVRTQVSSDDFEKMKEDLAKRGLTI